jgi:Arc/MetJ-type ribon-helix-helix transcriptional regulator
LHTSLKPSLNYGIFARMGEMRKITVEVPDDDLAAAREYTGAGISETVRAALARLRSDQAQKKARALRGKVKFSMTWQEMKYDRE